ncbi:hypothetical protein L596_030202 [Steinernema carpocapsae]|uniref:Uncharacterized protein n=1 Tax=Steinernema carpocapsae TaxID=34508 RepID=A0A4U5LS09_STECR|nr:hypothetical protein L596_030202 [Steinernema carpocapsae]
MLVKDDLGLKSYKFAEGQAVTEEHKAFQLKKCRRIQNRMTVFLTHPVDRKIKLKNGAFQVFDLRSFKFITFGYFSSVPLCLLV